MVTLLPKKGDHGRLAQRPISFLPMIYRLWAAARADMLKKWFAENRHESALGQGLGKGAGTAAWMRAGGTGECQRAGRLRRLHRL